MPIANSRVGRGFGGLARYLISGSDGQATDRVDWISSRNLLSEDPQEAAIIMSHSAARSAWVQKPVYHLSINWPVEDRPNRLDMEIAVDRVLNDLGLQDHQALLVAHRDTEHPHVHLMVNRVDPETQKAWRPNNDWYRLRESLHSLEKDMGWRIVAGAKWKLEHANGDNALRIRKAAWEPMHISRTWAELEDRLHEKGLTLQARGRGLIVTDGKYYVKASEVDRAVSRPRLEERFGMTHKEWRDEVKRVQKLAKNHRRLGKRAAREANPLQMRARAAAVRHRLHQVETALDGSGNPKRIVEAKIAAFALRFGMTTLRRVSPAAAAILQAARMAKHALERQLTR